MRKSKQKDGIQKAKERGVQFGKRKKLNPEQIAELQQKRQEGVLIKTLMKEYDLSKSSVYRYLNETISLPNYGP
jgi:DNA invertase Pin-like site-specific DNA recombinase